MVLKYLFLLAALILILTVPLLILNHHGVAAKAILVSFTLLLVAYIYYLIDVISSEKRYDKD